jgi:hypothetical protein
MDVVEVIGYIEVMPCVTLIPSAFVLFVLFLLWVNTWKLTVPVSCIRPTASTWVSAHLVIDHAGVYQPVRGCLSFDLKDLR